MVTTVEHYADEIGKARRRFGVWRILSAAFDDEEVGAEGLQRLADVGIARIGELAE